MLFRSANCTAELVIPEVLDGYKVTAIGVNAFKNAGLTTLSLPSSLIEMGDWSFEGNFLTSIQIPSSVVTIAPGVFYRNQITSVSIPVGVKSIGAWTFANNAVTYAEFAGDAPENNDNIFTGDDKLSAINVTYGTLGWSETFSGISVVGAGTPTPTETAKPTDSPVPTETATPTESASPSETAVPSVFTYRLNKEKTSATITGCIACTSDVVIPAVVDGYPVTAIGAFAFEYQRSQRTQRADFCFAFNL